MINNAKSLMAKIKNLSKQYKITQNGNFTKLYV